MARVLGYLLALVFVCSISAVPVPPQDTLVSNSVACNVARVETASGLSDSSAAMIALQQVASNDTAVATAADVASKGLSDTADAASAIANVILSGSGVTPPDLRDRAAQGLFTARDALSNITSTDPAVSAALAVTQAAITRTIDAGQNILQECK